MEHAGYIDGKLIVGAGQRFEVENPSDESIVDTVVGLSVGQVEQAVTAARRSFDDGRWRGLPATERARILRRFGEAMAARTDRYRTLAVLEAGCPVSSSVMMAQVDAPIRQTFEIIDLFLSLPEFEDNPLPMHERVTARGVLQSRKRWSPLGVVTAIGAYNVPLFTAHWKVLPALIAGNSVIVRPNPLTPLSSMLYAEAAEEAGLPPGVLNVVVEDGLDGARLLTTDPRVDMVSFTGSCTVGAKVAEQSAPTLKRVVLELGGKSANIFLPDALDRAPMQALTVCTSHAGQGCAIGSRIFVPEDKKAEVLEQMAELYRKVKIGPASDPATQTGPVISAAQRARCEHFTKAAVEHGGRVVCGGKRPEHLAKGYYWEPTVLDLPDNDNPAAQDEIFGPVLSVIGYRDLDHAVEMANASKFGLSGYVNGRDAAAALKVALAIRSGTVNVNAGAMSSYASTGGIKMSGLGRERGVEGLREFQMFSTLNVGA